MSIALLRLQDPNHSNKASDSFLSSTARYKRRFQENPDRFDKLNDQASISLGQLLNCLPLKEFSTSKYQFLKWQTQRQFMFLIWVELMLGLNALLLQQNDG
jgi:predicted component of type VI protein secretion system